MKLLIVNADDLGYDPEIDRGILEAHAGGMVTSATAMVDTPFAARALAAAPQSLDVGLHVALRPGADPAHEIASQLERFRALRGAPPTHLDSHRHAHAAAGALPAFAAAARREGIPLRALDPGMRAAVRAMGVASCDGFVGDAALRPCWTLERLVRALSELPEGVTELMCHPGHAPSHARTSFGAEREIELAALCDPAARRALASGGASLTSFRTAFPAPG